MKIITDSMSDSRTRVYLACLHLFERNGRVTVREVAAGAGMSVASTHGHLRALRVKGLVAWDDGSEGTLRPLYREVEQ